MSEGRADIEKVVVLPICWHSATLSRLSRVVDPEALRAHRQMLLDGLDERIDALSTLAENGKNDSVAAILDAKVRKDLNTLAVLVANFGRKLDELIWPDQ